MSARCHSAIAADNVPLSQADVLREAGFALSGNENSAGACDLIADAEGAVRGIAHLNDVFSELSEKLSALRAAFSFLWHILKEPGI